MYVNFVKFYIINILNTCYNYYVYPYGLIRTKIYTLVMYECILIDYFYVNDVYNITHCNIFLKLGGVPSISPPSFSALVGGFIDSCTGKVYDKMANIHILT